MNQILLNGLNTDELKELLKEAVRECLTEIEKKLSKEKSELTDDELLSTKEVMKILKISRPTLNKWIKKGLITYRKVLRRNYFKKSDIENALTKIEHKSWHKLSECARRLK